MTRLPAAERREQLLDVAQRLFAQLGYARTTTSELARAAGVTEPIIYRHFESKRDLFVALIVRTGQRTLDAWARALAGCDDPLERLRRLIRGNPMVTPEGSEAYRVFLQAISETGDGPIRDAVDAHIRSAHAFVQHEVEQAQSAGVVHERFSGELLGWLLIDVGLGYGVLEALGVAAHGRDRAGTHTAELVETLVVRRP